MFITRFFSYEFVLAIIKIWHIIIKLFTNKLTNKIMYRTVVPEKAVVSEYKFTGRKSFIVSNLFIPLSQHMLPT